MKNFFILKNGDFSFVSQSMEQLKINLDFENKYNEFNGFGKFIPFFYDHHNRKLPSVPDEICSTAQTKIISSNNSLAFFKDMFESINGNFGSVNDVGDQRRVCTIPLHVEKDKVNIIEKSLDMLLSFTPWIFNLMKLTVTNIVPCNSDNKPLGGSGGLFLGTILFSVNNRTNTEIDVSKLSVKVAHEIAHQVLFIYEYLDPIIYKEHRNFEIYSPQRLVKRKLFQAFHAIAVSFYELFVYANIINCNSLSQETRENHFKEARNLTIHLERGIGELENLKIEFPQHTVEIIKEFCCEFMGFKNIFN